MLTLEDYQSDDPAAWCPGCGNHGILKALKEALGRTALVKQRIDPSAFEGLLARFQ